MSRVAEVALAEAHVDALVIPGDVSATFLKIKFKTNITKTTIIFPFFFYYINNQPGKLKFEAREN